jgi:tRNA U34 5-methylaminomethyl-2-thiouridine-forming methyltransferase MnmC
MSIKTTADGSKTVFSETFQECYHSINGAVTESMHVFIDAGYRACDKDSISIFEVGFGTGLNAYLTYLEAKKHNIGVNYHAIEMFPLEDFLIAMLDYPEFLSTDMDAFRVFHDSTWNKTVMVSSNFSFKKIKSDLLKIDFTEKYDLVYFDAFSPNQQPELWTEFVFKKLFDQMNSGGILTTYCAKGDVRRTLNKVGFTVERLPGPPGKHEMLRARKG